MGLPCFSYESSVSTSWQSLVSGYTLFDTRRLIFYVKVGLIYIRYIRILCDFVFTNQAEDDLEKKKVRIFSTVCGIANGFDFYVSYKIILCWMLTISINELHPAYSIPFMGNREHIWKTVWLYPNTRGCETVICYIHWQPVSHKLTIDFHIVLMKYSFLIITCLMRTIIIWW